MNRIETTISGLCEAYGIHCSSRWGDDDVMLWKDDEGWHVDHPDLDDQNWAPSSEFDLKLILEASTPERRIKRARSFESLYHLLRDLSRELDDEQLKILSDSMSDLPTFGPAPPSTVGVWSWNDRYLLVGDGWNDLKIVEREE